MFIEGFVVKNAEYVFTPGVIVEDLGSDSAVLVLQASEVLTLSGDAATVVRRIRDGESVEGAESVVSDLVARGVIEPAQGMSRRGVVRAGVIGAGVGIAALAMPSIAAASSDGDDGMFIDPDSEFVVPVFGVRVFMTDGEPAVVLEVFIVVERLLDGEPVALGLRAGQTGVVKGDRRESEGDSYTFPVTFDPTPIAAGQIDNAPPAPDGAFRSGDISNLSLAFNDPQEILLSFTVGGTLFEVEYED